MAKKPKRKLSAYNKHMSREMKRGRSFKQAVASWKGGKKSSPKKRGTSTTRTTTRRSNRVGKKGGFNTSRIYKWVRIGALAAPAVYHGLLRPGTPEYKARNIILRYTGFDMIDGKWRPEYLAEGYGPAVGATIATYGIPKLAGIIRGL